LILENRSASSHDDELANHALYVDRPSVARVSVDDDIACRTRRATSRTSDCVRIPKSGSPRYEAETPYPVRTTAENPTLSAILAERTS
jgi:hypothetical protein